MERQHLAWVDVLRIFACMLVIMTHVVTDFTPSGESASGALLVLYDFVRPGVPLFVMISGVVLMPDVNRPKALIPFYKKRIGRLAWPLIFWSIILPYLFFIIFGIMAGTSVSEMFAWPNVKKSGILLTPFSWIIACNGYTFVYWYLYMLLGLYLVLPIVNAWLHQASKKDLQVILALWIFTLFIPYIEVMAPHMKIGITDGKLIFGAAKWNIFGTFYYISGYMGYYLLAHYLMKYPIKWNLKNKFLTVLTYAVGLSLTIWLNIWLVDGEKFGYVITLVNNCGIFVFLMSVSLFILIQNWKLKDRKWLRWTADKTFGIYLTHLPVVVILTLQFEIIPVTPYVSATAEGMLTFIICAFITWLFKTNRFTARFVN